MCVTPTVDRVTAEQVHALLADAGRPGRPPALVHSLTGAITLTSACPAPRGVEVLLLRAELEDYLDPHDVEWHAYPDWVTGAEVDGMDLDDLLDRGLDPWDECAGRIEHRRAVEVAAEITAAYGLVVPDPDPAQPARRIRRA